MIQTTEVQKQQLTQALNEFKEMNPWKGKIKERKEKFILTYQKLKQIYDMPGWSLAIMVAHHYRDHEIEVKPHQEEMEFDGEVEVVNTVTERGWHPSGASSCNREYRVITLTGRLSVITFLHEWGHALGGNEEQAQKYAVDLFKQAWPDKFAKLLATKNGRFYENPAGVDKRIAAEQRLLQQLHPQTTEVKTTKVKE